MAALRYQGTFVGDRANADAALNQAAVAFADLKLAREQLKADTAGAANRLADYVADAERCLRTARCFLEQRGEA